MIITNLLPLKLFWPFPFPFTDNEKRKACLLENYYHQGRELLFTEKIELVRRIVFCLTREIKINSTESVILNKLTEIIIHRNKD